MHTSWKVPVVFCLSFCFFVAAHLTVNSIMTTRTNELLKVVIRTQFQQHLDQTNLGDPAAVIRRFALGYTLQKETKIWTDEEWNRITNEDIPHYLQQNPKAHGLANESASLLDCGFRCIHG